LTEVNHDCWITAAISRFECGISRLWGSKRWRFDVFHCITFGKEDVRFPGTGICMILWRQLWYSERWTTGWMIGGSCHGRGREFFYTPPRPDRLWSPPSLVPNGYQGLFPWGRGVKLTTHLHLVLRSKSEWSYTSTPPILLHGVVLSLKHRDNFTFTFQFQLQTTWWARPIWQLCRSLLSPDVIGKQNNSV
jgi:hypothetical protein